MGPQGNWSEAPASSSPLIRLVFSLGPSFSICEMVLKLLPDHTMLHLPPSRTTKTEHYVPPPGSPPWCIIPQAPLCPCASSLTLLYRNGTCSIYFHYPIVGKNSWIRYRGQHIKKNSKKFCSLKALIKRTCRVAHNITTRYCFYKSTHKNIRMSPKLMEDILFIYITI